MHIVNKKMRLRRWAGTTGALGATGLLLMSAGGAAAAAAPAGAGTLAGAVSSRVASVAVNGDSNPYSLAVVPLTAGKLKAGDVLVADFNHGAAAGTGTTIVQVDPGTGVSSVFASGLPISGPVGIAINPANDGVWIGDFGQGSGSASNDLLILPTGVVKAKYNSATVKAKPGYHGPAPTFDGVWGEGVSKHAGKVSFYYGTTGSGADGTGGGQVWRIDPKPTGAPNGQPVNSTYVQIATGLSDNHSTKALPVTAANAAGPQGFAYDAATGVLYVSNDADNTITVIAGAATATGPVATRTVPVAAGVLNVPENIALDPANGDLLIVNAGTNTLTEVNPTTGAVAGTQVLDGGAAGALFGLAVTSDTQGHPVIFYGNSNDNTLNMLRLNPGVNPVPVGAPQTGGGSTAATGHPMLLIIGVGFLLTAGAAGTIGYRRRNRTHPAA